MRYSMPTDNPIRDADNYQYDRDFELMKRPSCYYCDEYIQECYAYEDDFGHLYCKHCVENLNHQISLEKVYIED